MPFCAYYTNITDNTKQINKINGESSKGNKKTFCCFHLLWYSNSSYYCITSVKKKKMNYALLMFALTIYLDLLLKYSYKNQRITFFHFWWTKEEKKNTHHWPFIIEWRILIPESFQVVGVSVRWLLDLLFAFLFALITSYKKLGVLRVDFCMTAHTYTSTLVYIIQ